MTPDLLTRIGEALYGPFFKPPLAEALGVRLRAVQLWCAGSEPMPPGAVDDLREIVRNRETQLGDAREELEEFLNAR